MSKIVGKEMVDYLSRKSNQQVTGIKLHIIRPDNRVEGFAAESVFISSKSALYEAVTSYPLNTEVLIMYNRYGSVEDVKLVTADTGKPGAGGK